MRKTLAENDFGQIAELNAGQVRQLYEATDWVDIGENLQLFGQEPPCRSNRGRRSKPGPPGQVLQRRELLQELRIDRAW